MGLRTSNEPEGRTPGSWRRIGAPFFRRMGFRERRIDVAAGFAIDVKEVLFRWPACVNAVSSRKLKITPRVSCCEKDIGLLPRRRENAAWRDDAAADPLARVLCKLVSDHQYFTTVLSSADMVLMSLSKAIMRLQ